MHTCSLLVDQLAYAYKVKEKYMYTQQVLVFCPATENVFQPLLVDWAYQSYT